MKYRKYTIRVNAGASEIISALLPDLGINAVEIEDGEVPLDTWTAGTYLDELPENNVPEGEAYLSFYMENEDEGQMLSDVRDLLDSLRDNLDVGEGSITVSETEDKDWINNWKEYFHSFEIGFEDGRKAGFVPSWEEPDEDMAYDYLIRIDPGTAFGTGAHETTRLAIRFLQKYTVKGDSLLDIGIGSGILSIMAFLFGAERALGIDIDPNSEPAVLQNLRDNGLENADFQLRIGNILKDKELYSEILDKGPYQIITANILPDVLIPLLGMISPFLADGGHLVLSGIIQNKSQEMVDAIGQNGFSIVEAMEDGEWIGFIVQRP